MAASLTRLVRHGLAATLRQSVILAYHRVARLDHDPQLLAVTPEHFAEHLEVLREQYAPVRLGRLPGDMGLVRRGRPWVAVTFDDGYADNLRHAAPLLQRADVPATVFVVAGQVDSEQEFWWDELERILLDTPSLPSSLTLAIDGRAHRWNLLNRALRRPDWNVLTPGLRLPREAAYHDLCELLRALAAGERDGLIDQLRSWAGLTDAGRPDYRALTSEGVTALAEGGLVEVGSHTLTHSVLASQTPDEQRREIERSKRRLEDLTQRQVTAFSYPYGQPHQYTKTTIHLLRNAGFTAACTTQHRRVFRFTGRHQLPRFLVRDWTGEEFSRRLRSFVDG